MKDILLSNNGDLAVNEFGDISLTDSVRQAVKVRLLWFFNEWRFSPAYGVPYFEEILVKDPDIERVRRIVRDEVVSVDEVIDARNVKIVIDKQKRTAAITLDIVTSGETFREEVLIHV